MEIENFPSACGCRDFAELLVKNLFENTFYPGRHFSVRQVDDDNNGIAFRNRSENKNRAGSIHQDVSPDFQPTFSIAAILLTKLLSEWFELPQADVLKRFGEVVKGYVFTYEKNSGDKEVLQLGEMKVVKCEKARLTLSCDVAFQTAAGEETERGNFSFGNSGIVKFTLNSLHGDTPRWMGTLLGRRKKRQRLINVWINLSESSAPAPPEFGMYGRGDWVSFPNLRDIVDYFNTGRSGKFEKNPDARLTDDDVKQAVQYLAGGDLSQAHVHFQTLKFGDMYVFDSSQVFHGANNGSKSGYSIEFRTIVEEEEILGGGDS